MLKDWSRWCCATVLRTLIGGCHHRAWERRGEYERRSAILRFMHTIFVASITGALEHPLDACWIPMQLGRIADSRSLVALAAMAPQISDINFVATTNKELRGHAMFVPAKAFD